MKGFGYYDDRAYYPSSSNLSAFAAPFSVNKFASKDVSAPYVDLAESTDAIPSNHFPVHSRSYGYDFFSNPVRELDSTPSSNSKAYGYPGLQVLDPPASQLPHFNTLGLASKDAFAYDQLSNSIKSNIVEAQPYYPSYISPSVHDANPSASPNQWSPASGFGALDESKMSSEIGHSGERAGLWSQFTELNHGKSKQVEVGGSFCSKETNFIGSSVEENFMNQGCQDAKASGSGEVLHNTHIMGWEKHAVPISADQLDNKSSWWQTANSVPFNFSSTSVQGSPSLSQETHYEAPLNFVADSGSHHFSYTTSNGNQLRLHDKPSVVDAGSSAPITGIAMDFNVGNIAASGDLGGNTITIMKEAYPLPSSGGTGCFDFSQLCMQLEKNEPSSSSNVAHADTNVTTDVMDYVFKARHGFENPQASLNNLSLGFSTNEGVNSIEKSFDSFDRYNPAVDSPCWKGAPAAHFSPFEVPEALCPEYVKSNVVNFSSNSQGPQDFLLDAKNNAEISCENSKDNQIDSETDYLEKGLAGSSRKFSVTDFASEENNLHGTVNAGCFESKPIHDCGSQHLDDISEMRGNSLPSSKSTHDSESRFSNNEQYVTEENKCMSQKQHTLYGGCADAKINMNECLKYGASPAADPSLSSSSSVVAEPTAFKQSAPKVSTPKINIQILVDAMHNLSELLLFHCSNDACELKEEDRNVLSNVISNLNTCALKNAEQMLPVQQSIFTQQDPSKCAKESHEHQQNARFERPHLTKVDPACSKVELGNQPVKEVKTHHFVSGKEGKFSDSFPTKGDTDMMKEDNMTKALKRVLSENFHDEKGADSQALLYKNLWLEAEAAICSINLRARYKQIKIEMEKCSMQKDNYLSVEAQSKQDDPKLSTAQSSATKVNIVPNPNYSAENFPVLNGANSEDLFGLKFSPDLNKPCTFTPEDNGSQNLCSFIQGSVSGTNKKSGDCETSTKAFYACNSMAEMSCDNTTNSKKIPSSEASHALDTTDKLASGQTDSEDHLNFTKVTPNPGKNKVDDYASSVMARFHILKSRVEESGINTANPEGLSSSEVSHALDRTDKLASGQTGSENKVNFTQLSPFPGNNKADDCASSVMARFHILKSRNEESDINAANPEEPLSSEVSHALDPADKLASGQTDGENQVNFTQVSPFPGKNKADVSSVMTRFHILKSRAEDSSSMSSEGQLLDGAAFAGHGSDCTIIRNASEDHSLDVNINPAVELIEQSITEEFNLNLLDDQETQPHETYRFGIQLPTYSSDGFSSEWEHVKVEEYAGQTFKP